MLKTLLILPLLFAPACSGPASTEATPPGVQELGIPNLVAVDARLFSSGQPSPAHLAALSAGGVQYVIQLRPATETGSGWEEHRAAELGLGFTRIPIAGNDDMTEENARRLDRALAEAQAAEGRRVLLSCASGNRCGGLLALRAFYCQGATPKDALALGKRAGMTRTEPAVRRLLGLTEE